MLKKFREFERMFDEKVGRIFSAPEKEDIPFWVLQGLAAVIAADCVDSHKYGAALLMTLVFLWTLTAGEAFKQKIRAMKD